MNSKSFFLRVFILSTLYSSLIAQLNPHYAAAANLDPILGEGVTLMGGAGFIRSNGTSANIGLESYDELDGKFLQIFKGRINQTSYSIQANGVGRYIALQNITAKTQAYTIAYSTNFTDFIFEIQSTNTYCVYSPEFDLYLYVPNSGQSTINATKTCQSTFQIRKQTDYASWNKLGQSVRFSLLSFNLKYLDASSSYFINSAGYRAEFQLQYSNVRVPISQGGGHLDRTYQLVSYNNYYLSDSSLPTSWSWSSTSSNGIVLEYNQQYDAVCIRSTKTPPNYAPNVHYYLSATSNGQQMTSTIASTCSNSLLLWKIQITADTYDLLTLSGLNIAFIDFQGQYMTTQQTFNGFELVANNKSSQSSFKLVWYGNTPNWYLQSSYNLYAQISPTTIPYLPVGISPKYQGILQTSYQNDASQLRFVKQLNGTYCIKGTGTYQSYYFYKTIYGRYAVTNTAECPDGGAFNLIVLSDISYIDISYQQNQLQSLQLKPVVLAQTILDNRNTTESQSMSFSFKQTSTNSYSFEETEGSSWTHHFDSTLTASLEFSESAIFVSAKETFSLSLSYGFAYESSKSKTYGQNQEMSTEWTVESPIVVPPGKVFKCFAQVQQASVSVPYIGTIHYTDVDATSKVTGIYKETLSFNLQQTCQELKSLN